jgi:DNA-binding XRE family transcriptional regulator
VPAGQLKARELEDRLEDLRTAVLTAIEAHEHGEPAERVFAELKRRLEHVPAGRWDPDLCIEKAHEWVELYGDPPAAIDWNPAGIKGRTVGEGRAERREEMLGRWLSGDWPSLATVQRLFGSWNAFLMEAGYPPRKPGDERPSDHQRRVGIGHLPEWTGWGIVSSYRQRMGLSQAQLADRAGLSVEYIGFIERGRQTNPSVRVLLALARALTVQGAVLLDDNRPDRGRGAAAQ